MKISLTHILLVALVVMVTWTVRGCFTKSPPNEALIRAEMKIEKLEEGRLKDSVQLVEYRQERDEAIDALKLKDETKVREIKTIVTKIENVPYYINSLDRDSLRAKVLEQ